MGGRRVCRDSESNEFGHRVPQWSESLAVGSWPYVAQVAEKLGMKSNYRKEHGQDGVFVLRESKTPYNVVYKPENAVLSTYFDWKYA